MKVKPARLVTEGWTHTKKWQHRARHPKSCLLCWFYTNSILL